MPDTRSPGGAGKPRALDQLRSMLVPGETIEAWAIQRRIFSLFHRRQLVAATSGRFIAISRPLLGGFDPTDVRWQDLTEVKIKVGPIGASLALVAEASADLTAERRSLRRLVYTGLSRSEAEEVYRICQAHDQAWREKRRVREMEELRARAGGVQILGGGAASSPSSPSAADSSVERLRQAKEMLDAKLITDSEYEAIKARIINSV